MKRTIFFLTILFLLINLTISLIAVEEADVKIQLDKAMKSIQKLKIKRHLADYIPYSFSLAFQYYNKAKKLLDDSDEEEAYYYAYLADIEAQISYTIALTRRMKVNILKTKKQYYHKLSQSDKKDRKYQKIISKTKKYYKEQLRKKEIEVARLAKKIRLLNERFNKRLLVLKAGFSQSPYGLKITLSTASLFVGRSSNISSSGKIKLMEIAKVIKIFQEKKVMISSHSNRYDWKNRRTKSRLKSVTQFLSRAGDVIEKMIIGAAHGNTKKLVRWGSANDRIEIIIHKAKLN